MGIAATTGLGKWTSPAANPTTGTSTGTAGVDRQLDVQGKPRRALAAGNPDPGPQRLLLAAAGSEADPNPRPQERLLLAPVAEPPKEGTNPGGALGGVTGGSPPAAGTGSADALTKREHTDTNSVGVSKSAQVLPHCSDM